MGCTRSKPKPKARVRVIVVCSKLGKENVQGLIQYIIENMSGVVGSAIVKYEQLPYNSSDMKEFELGGIDALLVCHSVDIKGPVRAGDESNTIYHKFLHKAKNCLGKKKVAVIMHDYKRPLESDSKTLKSTFPMTAMVLALGKLAAGGSLQMTAAQLKDFTSFFRGALSYRRKIKGALYRFFYCLTCQ